MVAANKSQKQPQKEWKGNLNNVHWSADSEADLEGPDDHAAVKQSIKAQSWMK